MRRVSELPDDIDRYQFPYQLAQAQTTGEKVCIFKVYHTKADPQTLQACKSVLSMTVFEADQPCVVGSKEAITSNKEFTFE